MTRIKADEKQLNPKFLAIQLHALWSKGFFNLICHSHVSQASVSTNRLKEVKIALPSLKIQKDIILKLEKVKEKYNIILKEQDKTEKWLKELPKSVLSKAFKGELV